MQVFLIALVTGFAYFTRRFMGELYLERPVVLGPIIGLILGDVQAGLLIGGTLELIFMGAADIGGSVPSNYAIGTAVGVFFMVTGNLNVEQALAIAIPAALLGSFCELFAKTIGVFFVNAAERYAEKCNTRMISILMHLGNIAHGLAYAIPVFVLLQFGEVAVTNFMSSIPAGLNNGITLAGKVLPALGFALLLSTLSTKKLMPFFFIGFVIASYTGMGVLGTAVLALLIAIVIESFKEDSVDFDDLDGDLEESAGHETLLSKSDVKTLYWRSFAVQSAFSFDRMQAMGFTWNLIPLLKREYADKPKELAEALKRHLAFFNTMPWLNGPIVAITAEMEIKKARGEDVDPQAIQGIKSALMGPLAGIGDSLFHGTLRPIVGGVCASLALSGNGAAPFIFFITLNAVHCLVRWYTLSEGVKAGDRMFGMFASSAFRNFMEGAMITGLMAAGSLVATWLNFGTPLAYVKDGAEIALQNMVDGIFPKLLPLSVTMIVFYFVRKGVKTTYIMLGLIVASLILGGLGILG